LTPLLLSNGMKLQKKRQLPLRLPRNRMVLVRLPTKA
jgi:hypothetical protein